MGETLHGSTAGVEEGDVLAGKYRVERVLGIGGMGVVVAAHHIQLDEKVALKFLLPQALTNAEALGRFEREARAAVKIKSEHVARVTDVGKLENGAPYMVMEYLEGGDLSALLTKQGKLAADQAVDFVLQASEAIAEAHSLGIVHRDLKPSNLFCIRKRDGQLSIKVLDFGISKVTGTAGAGSASRDMGMTKTTAVVGSPVYMSPEQMQSSKGVDHRTDVWSMGVILYELLTGRVPFEADTVTELAVQIVTEPAPPLGAATLGFPAGLEQVVLHCLEKARDKRFQTVGDLAEALLPFAPPRARASIERIHGILGPPSPSPSSSDLVSNVAPPSAVSPATTGPSALNKSSSTVAEWQNEPGSKGGKAKPNRTVIGLAAAATVATVVALVAVLHKSAPPATVPIAVATPVPTIATATASAPAPAPASAPAPATAPAPAPPIPSPAAPHHPSPPSHPAAPAPAPSKAHCTPPYYFDDQGNRVFKKECLQ